MALKKCPRCEVNYIHEDEKVCNVCRRYMKGEKDVEDNITMCSECGENPAVKGSELCAACLREARRQEKLLGLDPDAATSDELLGGVGLDAMEVPLPAEGEIPESELEEIDKELSDGDDKEEDEEEASVDDDEDEDDYAPRGKTQKHSAFDDDDDDDDDEDDDYDD